MQRRRAVAGNRAANPFQSHGRVGTFTRNMNTASSSSRSNKLIIIAMFTIGLGLFYVQEYALHSKAESNILDLKLGGLVEKNDSGVGSEFGNNESLPVPAKPFPSSNTGRSKIQDTGDGVNSMADELVTKKIEVGGTRGIKENEDVNADHNIIDKDNAAESKTKTKELISQMRQTFYDRYGGELEAAAMLKRGITPAAGTPEDEKKAIAHTAERIILARQNTREFVMSFGGYSVTVGRGNYYNQSYPFILQEVLKPVFEAIDLELVVRNSAIGGIPSFPYGWCLPNFLGTDSDVVSWDYGMNEGSEAQAFESYMRQSIATLPKRPMMIMLDTKRSRVDMMKAYNGNGALLDSIAVGRGDVVKKDYKSIGTDDSTKPIGFQKWNEWGAPKGSPGQSNWHPKKMEHELIAWMIAMRFLDSLEAAVDMLDSGYIVDNEDSKHEKLALLPPPISHSHLRSDGGPETPSHILYGIPLDSSDRSELAPWVMDAVSCRTSFLPNIHGKLSEIVVSGLAEDVGDDLKSRDDSLYTSGWVVDVGKVERATKRKVESVGGLGYIDMKNAMYGIPESGTLRLSLPHERPVHNHSHNSDADMLARHWFETLVFCEVNEKRGKDECVPETDMTFIVGNVKSESVVQITNAAAYLKKSICLNVNIPEDARVTVKDPGDEGGEDVIVELTVDVSVSNKGVTRKNGACSISHVVWQSH